MGKQYERRCVRPVKSNTNLPPCCSDAAAGAPAPSCRRPAACRRAARVPSPAAVRRPARPATCSPSAAVRSRRLAGAAWSATCPRSGPSHRPHLGAMWLTTIPTVPRSRQRRRKRPPTRHQHADRRFEQLDTMVPAVRRPRQEGAPNRQRPARCPVEQAQQKARDAGRCGQRGPRCPIRRACSHRQRHLGRPAALGLDVDADVTTSHWRGAAHGADRRDRRRGSGWWSTDRRGRGSRPGTAPKPPSIQEDRRPGCCSWR